MTGPVDGAVTAMPLSLQILHEACGQSGYAFELIDRFAGALARVGDPAGRGSFLSGAGTLPAYPGNDMVLAAVARDKAHAAALLEQRGFRTPEGGHFFLSTYQAGSRPPGREIADALAFADRLSSGFAQPLVVKPNSGARARDVALARSADDLRQLLAQLARSDQICLIQRLIRAPEFRLFLVGGEVAFCYAKRRPQVRGDGASTIAELLRQAGNAPAGERYVAVELAARGLTMADVLSDGVVLETDFVANISAAGSLAGLVAVSEAGRDWARALHDALPLAVMGIDVFSASGLAEPADCIVTDVNGSPALATLYGLGERDLVLRTWQRIIEHHFAAGGPPQDQGRV